MGFPTVHHNARLWSDRAEFVTTKSAARFRPSKRELFSISRSLQSYHNPRSEWRRRLSDSAGICRSLSMRTNEKILLYCSTVSPRASRNSWGSSQWWSDWGTSTASAACTSPGPVRSCRPGRRSAPRRSPFARTCAWTASPTAPACRLSAHRWWSPAAHKCNG